MKVLVLGGDGMLGHRLLIQLRPRHDVRVTLRQDSAAYRQYGLFNGNNSYFGVDVRIYERLVEVISDFKPEAVVNAIGIVKQRSEAKEIIPSLELNALLPHRLALLCKAFDARFVHLSTDCVFSGKRGNYGEGAYSDAEDIYGRTKYLGEVRDGHGLTLRTSIIGRELSRRKSLLEWFLSQPGPVRGFTRAIYSGFTTLEMSRIIEMMLTKYPAASGVYHVSSDPISKYELLSLVKAKMGHDIGIVPDDDFRCDRSLDSTRFRSEFNYSPPSWTQMIEELRDIQ